MQQMKRPPEYTNSCRYRDAAIPSNTIQEMPPMARMSASPNGKRPYQRGLSKQMMKLNKYSVNGRIQRNGITATSWHTMLVVASSSVDAQAGSSSHKIRLTKDGGESG